MKTFYLQQEKNGRQFIDEQLHEGCELVKTVEAANWKKAKEALTKPK